MNKVTRIGLSMAGAALACLSLAGPAQALPLILNGGFESDFANWTRADQTGSDGTFSVQSGALSPVNGDPVPAPTEGTNAAMSDAQGPGSHALYQDFLVDSAGGVLSFDLFIGNRADRFASPATLDFNPSTPPPNPPVLNQQVRVDILKAGADPFSVAAADVLLNLYQSNPGDPLVSGYATLNFDVSSIFAANLGQSLRLRFAETDNLAPLQLGIDNVRLSPLPEPASPLLLGAGLAALRRSFKKRRGQTCCMKRRGSQPTKFSTTAALILGLAIGYPQTLRADTTPLAMLDPNLQATPVLNTGITQPIGIVFLRADDYLVLEKASGQIKRVIGGVVQATPVLDLAVNSASERGLLSMVLDPGFATNGFVYVRWTESSTGADTTAVGSVPLLGNRFDRFVWNGSTLTFDRSLLQLRARQTDNAEIPGHPDTNNANENGNHNGGGMKFGPDGKLYLYTGDVGRRGWMQNLPNGPFLTAPLVDDTFGGPASDNAHLSGVILRLNTDGTAPPDNPFFAAGAAMGGEVGANIQKVYSYGHRNGFGMDFDPVSGSLWETENADDAYSELNRVIPGMNGGWIQLAGPLGRLLDWKTIEATQFGLALQQRRYPPTRAAYKPALALSRMFMLPGAVYVDPELSWRYEIGPAGAVFVQGNALGAEYNGTFWMGSSRAFQQVGANGGSLYRIKLTADRLHVDVSADPRLADKVADNLFRAQKFEGTESETLLIGKGFGTTTDIEQGPDGNLYVVSITDNAIYKISRRLAPEDL